MNPPDPTPSLPRLDRDLYAGNLVRLTAIRAADMPTIVGWYGDSRFGRLMESGPTLPWNEPAVTGWYGEANSAKSSLELAIRTLEDDRLVGVVGLSGIQWSNQLAEIGIGLGAPESRGKGYGREALRLMITYAFNELNLHRIEMGVFEYNSAAIGLYESLGFVHEGTHRDYIQRGGRRFSMLLYGLLRHEWNAEA